MIFVGHTLERTSLLMYSPLNNIGFYTLTEERAKFKHSNLERCEMIVTSFCNFKCPYCRGVKAYGRKCMGHIDYDNAKYILGYWIDNGLKSIRFSGGEPLLYPHINDLVKISKNGGIKNIAISSNGSLKQSEYEKLLNSGVNDFSISLDACCANIADKMSGTTGYFNTIISNMKYLSDKAYTTVGIVLTRETESTIVDVIKLAHDLNVADIRIITAAQYNGKLSHLEKVPQYIINQYPILKYRINNLINGRNVRGIVSTDTSRCYLVRDDFVVAGDWHFPCVIYMREGGEPIGKIGINMIAERLKWSYVHDTHDDLICVNNCLDCLVDYNNKTNYYQLK